MQGSFIAQLSELGILKRIKKIFSKFQKGIIYKNAGGQWPPGPAPIVGGLFWMALGVLLINAFRRTNRRELDMKSSLIAPLNHDNQNYNIEY